MNVQAAIGLVQHRTGVRFHRVVVFDRRAVVQVQTQGCAGKLGLKIPARLGQFGWCRIGLALQAQQIGLMWLGFVFNGDQ
ncbi:hypothetical protein D3C73_658540 [compost metagenome]